MASERNSGGFLSGNALKLLAAAAMLADHLGLMFFPGIPALRIVGRLAFPIFAFMIAQGCRYTSSRIRYFLQLFALAAVCQMVYYLADGSLYLSVLVTFSCSIAVIYALQDLKAALFTGKGNKVLRALVFVSSLELVWLLNQTFTIDYGFWGCMLPVFASVFQQRRGHPAFMEKADKLWVHVLMMLPGLLLLAADIGGWQIWSLASLPLLLAYSGKRGKHAMKYFFYIFYPAHLALLQVIAWVVF